MRKLLIFALIFLALSYTAAQERTAIQDEAAQQAWAEDVDYLLDRIMIMHPEPYHRFTQAELEQEASDLKAELPYLTDQEIVFGLLRLMSMQDGHTFLNVFQTGLETHLYPLRLYLFEEGVFVVNAAPEHA